MKVRPIETLLASFFEHRDAVAILDGDRFWSYGDLLGQVRTQTERLRALGVGVGSFVSIRGDFSFESCVALLSCACLKAVLVPLSSSGSAETERAESLGEPDFVLHAERGDLRAVRLERRTGPRSHLVAELIRRGSAGLIVFSSASSGAPKAILHDFDRFLGAISRNGKRLRTFLFLRFDHLGGLNTLFYTLSQAGTAVLARDRRPGAVCEVIQKHAVELLPVTPSFLSLLLASQEDRNWDLSSLKILSYGAEVMPEPVLERLRRRFPGVSIRQTYGLSETGALPVRQRGDGSLWIRLGSEGVATEIRNGTLWIRSDSAMLGYLNAPDPFDESGWLDTGDEVRIDGEYVRFLGRKSDAINVGGEKVLPAEVESVVGEVTNIKNVVVFGEPNALMGNVVAARVCLVEPESPQSVRHRIRLHCAARLSPHKRPLRVEIISGDLTNERMKKDRAQPSV